MATRVRSLGTIRDVAVSAVADGEFLKWSSAQSKWINSTVAPGAGASDFPGLTDTPANYTGAAGRLVRVNATPDGLEFFDWLNTQNTFVVNQNFNTGITLTADANGIIKRAGDADTYFGFTESVDRWNVTVGGVRALDAFVTAGILDYIFNLDETRTDFIVRDDVGGNETLFLVRASDPLSNVQISTGSAASPASIFGVSAGQDRAVAVFRGHSTQTNPILVCETSADSELFQVQNSGALELLELGADPPGDPAANYRRLFAKDTGIFMEDSAGQVDRLTTGRRKAIFYLEDPQGGEILPLTNVPFAATIVRVTHQTDTGSVSFNLSVQGESTPVGAGPTVYTEDQTADSTFTASTTFDGTDAIPDNNWLIYEGGVTPTGSPTKLWITVEYTED